MIYILNAQYKKQHKTYIYILNAQYKKTHIKHGYSHSFRIAYIYISYPPKWCRQLTALLVCYMTCATCTPYNHAPDYSVTSFQATCVGWVHVRLGVICHLLFWQNDRSLSRATAVVDGVYCKMLDSCVQAHSPLLPPPPPLPLHKLDLIHNDQHTTERNLTQRVWQTGGGKTGLYSKYMLLT